MGAMMRGDWRRGFTLIEVLISLALLSLVLLALYHSLELMRASNAQLFKYLKTAQEEKRGVEMLYLDIAGTSGKVVIEGDEMSRLCIEKTTNSLYGLVQPKVCWLVAKKDDTLIRTEGGEYKLPLESDSRVAVDKVLSNIELFNVTKGRGAILVVLRQKSKESISFMVQGIPEEQKGKGLPNGGNGVNGNGGGKYPNNNGGGGGNRPNTVIPQPPPAF